MIKSCKNYEKYWQPDMSHNKSQQPNSLIILSIHFSQVFFIKFTC